LKCESRAGNEGVVLISINSKGPIDWSADGQFSVYVEVDPKTNVDLWILPLFGDRKAFVFLQTPFVEGGGRFSPNGRWIAYTSNESGTNQIYVRPFPPAGGQWRVSTHGGSQPRWRRDGKEIVYLAGDRKLKGRGVKEDSGALTLGAPKPLFEARTVVQLAGGSIYDVTRDGQRFLVLTPVEETSPSPFTVVLNWTAGLKK